MNPKGKPPRLRLLRWLRQIFFDDAATPPCGGALLCPTSFAGHGGIEDNWRESRSPLLCQGGDFAFPAGCPRRPCPADDLWVTLKRWRKEGNNALSQLIHTFGVVSQDKVFPKLFLKRCPELTIPSAPASVAARLSFDGAATPSVSGGESILPSSD